MSPVMIGAGVAGVGLLGYALLGGSSYPPRGLSPTVKHLPQWITLGCGDQEYDVDGMGKRN